jgi:hypothetical protein
LDAASVVDKSAHVAQHGRGAALGRTLVRLPEAVLLQESTKGDVVVPVDRHVYNPIKWLMVLKKAYASGFLHFSADRKPHKIAISHVKSVILCS